MKRVVILGGCGHVGLPLGIVLADRGHDVVLLDVDHAAVDLVNSGTMPFLERDAEPALRKGLDAERLRATADPTVVGRAEVVIIVLGTPVDDHLNPDANAIPQALSAVITQLRDDQLLVLRSTVYPGVTALVERRLREQGLAIDVAYCPERIAEGQALEELVSLPQLVGGRTERATQRAAEFFESVAPTVVPMSAEEAELGKLFTNTWRYLKFAAANQFFMMANSQGLDYERIRRGLTQDYPRAADLPRAGFTAGPCLFKDTMQLAAFDDSRFVLGHSAMQINEGLPLYVVRSLEAKYPLARMTVGILGMAFKAGSDDTRSSLSYRLKRILRFRAAEVLTTDPYVRGDPDLLPLDTVLSRSDLVVVATPHEEYRDLHVEVPAADVWGVLGHGVAI